MLSYVDQTAYDWMHVLAASSGVGQYEINEFVKQLQAHGIGLAALDEFASSFIYPKSRQALPRTFFQDRINTKPDPCIKCFAGEVSSAVPIMRALIMQVRRPRAVLPEHCECMLHLCSMLEILSTMHRASVVLELG